MKIINDVGQEISEVEFKRLLDEIEVTLKFYAEKKFYEWEGCSCHGHYNILDHGGTAKWTLDTTMNNLKDLLRGE